MILPLRLALVCAPLLGRCRATAVVMRMAPGPAPCVMGVLHLLPTQLTGQVLSLPDRERHNGQRRVLGPAGRKLAAVRDEQIGDVVGLAILVAHPVLRLLALAAGALVLGAGEWRQLEYLFGAERLVDRRSRLVGVVAHGSVVGMVLKVHHRHRHPVLVLFRAM